MQTKVFDRAMSNTHYMSIGMGRSLRICYGAL